MVAMMAFLLVPDTVCFPHTSFPAPPNNCAVRAPPAKRLPEWRVRRDWCGWGLPVGMPRSHSSTGDRTMGDDWTEGLQAL